MLEAKIEVADGEEKTELEQELYTVTHRASAQKLAAHKSIDSEAATEPKDVVVQEVQLVRTRLNCNMMSKTLEKLLQDRKKQVTELAGVVKKDFEDAGTDADMQRRETMRKSLAKEIDRDEPETYNDNANLTEKMRKVLDLLPTVCRDLILCLRFEPWHLLSRQCS